MDTGGYCKNNGKRKTTKNGIGKKKLRKRLKEEE